MAQEPLVGRVPLIIDDSRSHSITHTTLGRTLLDEWSARRRGLYLTKQHSQETDIPASGGIRTRSSNKLEAADPRFRPPGHRVDKLCVCVCVYIYIYGPGSSVGITTDYGLDGPGSNPGGDEIFRPSRPALGPTQPSLSRG